MDEPLAGALAKLTTKGGKAIRALHGRGRQLVKSVPPPVQIQLARLSSQGAHIFREIFAGVVVVGLIAIVLGYGRLARGPISLPGLVPPIKTAINEQLSGLDVEIEDAVLQRSNDGPGVVLRLRNIRLIDLEGEVVAQAPLAAIGLSGSALLSGRIAPGSVDFIGSRLLMTYNEENGLSFAFSRPGEESDAIMRGSLPETSAPRERAPVAGAPSAGPGQALSPEVRPLPVASARKFNLTNAVNEVFQRVRRSDTSYLTRFGLKDSIVVLHQDGNQTLWQVPDFAIDLEHHDRRSVIVGEANIASSRGDWQLEVRTAQNPRTDGLDIKVLIENLVPSGIAGNFPTIGLLRALDMAVDGEAIADLSRNGDFIGGEAKVRLAPGQIKPPWDRDTPVRIDHGDVTVRYIKDKKIVEIAPSTLRWGKDAQATFSGTFRPVLGNDQKVAVWNFNIRATDAVLGVEEFGLGPTKVDEWHAKGQISPKDGNLTLSSFVIRAGGAKITASGTVTNGFESPAIRMSGELSHMSMGMLKQLWPKFLAGKARDWVLERVSGGQILGGTFNVALEPGMIEAIEQDAGVPKEAISVTLKFADTNIAYIPELPPVQTSTGTLNISGVEFSVDIPKGKVAVGNGMEIALSDGRFFIPDLQEEPDQGIITFKAAAATPAVMHLFDHKPLGFITEVGLDPDFLGGTATGEFTLSMPIKPDLDFKEIEMGGVARLENAIAPNIVGDLGIEGGAIDVELSTEGINASGKITIKDVPATVHWQRVFYASDDEQPPIAVSATLDAALREQLGLKLNHLVKGPTPVTLFVNGLGEGTGTPGNGNMRMEADLTTAELLSDSVGWTKPVGKEAKMSFDVLRKKDGSTDLENFKVVGDELAISGQIALDPENHLTRLYFSQFSVTPLTNVSIRADMGADVLTVHAEGPSYDGRAFFQSLFSAGQLAEGDPSGEGDAFDIDLTAKVGRLVGYEDTEATDVEIMLQKREGRLVALRAEGKLNGKQPIGVELKNKNGARILTAEALDAGSAFRLVGFYRRVQGGEASLQVNLDAGAADKKTGTLWVQNFAVVGDSVVSDVLSDPRSTAALGQNRRQVARKIVFKRLRAPFAIGSGKFQLNDAYVNGPQLGATLRGTVNFKSQTVDLGGTYVPLYGLNSALGAVPVLGRVFVGRQGEGVVGITFAIKGKLADPTVLVNPMSVMTPGIFRQIFDFSGGVPPGTASATTAKPKPIRPFQNQR